MLTLCICVQYMILHRTRKLGFNLEFNLQSKQDQINKLQAEALINRIK